MKVEGFKKLAVLLYATRLGHLPCRATSSLFKMRTFWGIIEDAYWLLDNATHYCSYRLVRKLRTAQYIVLAYTAFCAKFTQILDILFDLIYDYLCNPLFLSGWIIC